MSETEGDKGQALASESDKEMDKAQILGSETNTVQILALESDKPQTVAVESDKPQTLAMKSDKPQTLAMESDKPQTLAMESDKPQTLAMESDKPQTLAVESDKPQTLAMESDKPQTLAMESDKPQTLAMESDKPQTLAMESDKPQTLAMESDKPQTLASPEQANNLDVNMKEIIRSIVDGVMERIESRCIQMKDLTQSQLSGDSNPAISSSETLETLSSVIADGCPLTGEVKQSNVPTHVTQGSDESCSLTAKQPDKKTNKKTKSRMHKFLSFMACADKEDPEKKLKKSKGETTLKAADNGKPLSDTDNGGISELKKEDKKEDNSKPKGKGKLKSKLQSFFRRMFKKSNPAKEIPSEANGKFSSDVVSPQKKICSVEMMSSDSTVGKVYHKFVLCGCLGKSSECHVIDTDSYQSSEAN